MAVSPSFRTFVMEQLGDPRRLTARAMFGGVGLYWDGVFFGLVDDDTLYFKVDDRNRPEYEAGGMKPFDPYQDGRPMSYWEVPVEVLEDREMLAQWRRKAVEAARRGKAKKGRGESGASG